jgi:tetratricopeptide (TPR) repeat protein
MADRNESHPHHPVWLDAILLVLISLIAYGPTLFNGFVCDDQVYVLDNRSVTGPLNLHRIFTEPYPPGHPEQGLYRPAITLSFCLDHKLWGVGSRGAFGFHLTNNLLHALNGVLVLLLLGRLGMSRGTAFVAALLFAVHPALIEAVAWVVGRAELLGMTFGLLAILLFLREPCGLKKGAVLLLWLLAMFCKEHWLMLPFLVAVLAVCRSSVVRIERRDAIRMAAIAVAMMIAFWTARSLAIGSWRPELTAYTGVVSSFTRITTALMVLWKYVGIWLWPVHLSIQHDIRPVPGGIWTVVLLATWILAFWLVWRRRERNVWPLLALSWFWVALLMVSNLVVPVGAVFGERFLYGPTLFFAPVIVVLVWTVLTDYAPPEYCRILAVGLAAVVAGLLMTRIWVRLGDWHSNRAIWEAAAECYPDSMAIKAPLAETYLREGRFAEAHELASETIRRLEHQPRVYQKLLGPRLIALDAAAQTAMTRMVWFKKFDAANQLAQSFRLREALAIYRQLTQDYPEIPETFEAAGDVYVRLENPVAACQHFAEALRLGRTTPDLFAKYGTMMSRLGRKAEALMAYDQALRSNPKNALIHYNRGMVLVDLGDYSAALDAFRAASDLTPTMPEPYLNAAAVLIQLKRYDEAEREVMKVLTINPRQAEANELIERLAKVRGKLKK